MANFRMSLILIICSKVWVHCPHLETYSGQQKTIILLGKAGLLGRAEYGKLGKNPEFNTWFFEMQYDIPK